MYYKFDLTLWRALQVTYYRVAILKKVATFPRVAILINSKIAILKRVAILMNSKIAILKRVAILTMNRVAILIPHLRVAILMMTKTRALVNPQT